MAVIARAGGPPLPPMVIPVVKDAVPAVAEPFDLANVRLLDGPFKRVMETDAACLLNLDPNRFLAFFQRQAGLFTGEEERIDRMVDGLAACQETAASGL